MKKSLFLFVLVAACLMFASCSSHEAVKQQEENSAATHKENIGNNENSAPDTDKENVPPSKNTAELSKQAIEIMKKVPVYPEGYPTLEDAVELYKKANMAVGWIISTEPMAVYDDVSITMDGLEYKRVRPDCHYGKHNLEYHAEQIGQTQKLIYDRKCLEAYLATIINPEEAELYMKDAKDLKKFAEDENGNLYVLPFSYIPEGFGEEKYTLTDNEDGTYTFNVAYTLVDENGEIYKERTANFDLVQIDGRWVFDDFRVIRQN